ncbi:hypothetical protein [Nocardioides yefusunii]|uniref:Tetratricopeptide repeat protein n=1 Tax=Nocardioides yefusunii TaxID=2500546 RepID=A0ABW1QUM2_9ACTN|nr:hypothetical protein [Nocardioides yefusunii]
MTRPKTRRVPRTDLDRTDPTARGRRRRARIAAGVGTVVLGVVIGIGTVTTASNALGERAWRAGDLDAAQRWYGLSDRFDVTERWVAPYNLGIVAHDRGQWRRAVEEFARAAAVVPDEARCRVLVNQAVALEAWGDALVAADQQGAAVHYREAQGVLARAEGCSAESESEDAGDEAAEEAPEDEAPAQPGQEQSDQPADDSGEKQEESGDGEPGDGEPAEGEGEGEPGEGEPGEGDDGEEREKGEESADGTGSGSGSEQERRDAASERLTQKLGQGATPASQPSESTAEERAEEIAGRNARGQQVQQEARDQSAVTGRPPQQSGRTW